MYLYSRTFKYILYGYVTNYQRLILCWQTQGNKLRTLTFKGQRCQLVKFCHPGLTYTFYFLTCGHPDIQGWAPECPNVRN